MTNSDRLQEIRERAEKATTGPWEVESALFPSIESADGTMRIYDEGGHGYKDAIFIAEARSDIPYLLQLVTEQREVLDSAVRFIESALIICARSCNPGDGLHVSWGEDICKAARALGPLNALEELRQKNEAKGYRKQERPM